MSLYTYYYLLIYFKGDEMVVSNLQPMNKSLAIICDMARSLSIEYESKCNIYKCVATSPQCTRLLYRFDKGRLIHA